VPRYKTNKKGCPKSSEEYINSKLPEYLKSERPALMRLLADVKSGKVARLVTFEWSRLSRDFMFGLNLMQTLTEYKVPLYVPNEGLLKFDSATDQLMMAVRSFSAASERESIKQRIKSGIVKAKIAGKRIGAAKGSKSNRGYRKVYKGDDVAKVISLHEKGLSLSAIAESLNGKFSRSKIFNILRRYSS
jgi:DNA invertase Pin-like site-specific DNA recombinase